jgi:hypothetical protein
LAGVARVVGQDEALPEYDYHCSLMSLPWIFATTLDTLPARVPYLSAAPDKTAQWAARLGPRQGRRVGLAWSGNPGHKGDAQRSIPLAALSALACPGVRFIAVQKELRAADRPVLMQFPTLEWHGAALEDFDDTAALIDGLDLVITVDTAVAHLAGALGKPVWLLLPYAPDWRWLLDRGDSPWYPTARLFRQNAVGDWRGVIARVADALRQYAQP